MEQNIPTVTEVFPFDPRVDAEILCKAIEGLGTDEDAIITILCNRSNSQRLAISEAYKFLYNKELKTELKGDLSGNFKHVMVALCRTRADFLAHEMHDAISGLGTNEGTLIEILCSATNQEIHDINAAYGRLYSNSLEEDIKGDTSGDFMSMLVALTQGQRDENQAPDIQQVKEDAQSLYIAGEAKLGTDASVFISILTNRSLPHIRHLMVEYHAMHGRSLEQAIESEFSFYAKRCLLEILQCAKNRQAYFAEKLNNAVKGLGTKDRKLIRIIVSRCDIDLGNIKQEYEKYFGRSIILDVMDDTSGDYRNALLSLLG